MNFVNYDVVRVRRTRKGNFLKQIDLSVHLKEKLLKKYPILVDNYTTHSSLL